MIGSANKKYIPCAVQQESHPSRLFRSSGWGYNTNVLAGGVTVFLYFSLSGIAFNRGTKQLYVDGLRFRVAVADANDYVTAVEVRTVSLAAVAAQKYYSGTNYTSSYSVASNITAFACGGMDSIIIRIGIYSTTAGQVSFTNPQLRCYYA